MFLRETWKRNLFSAVSGTNTSATIGLTLREKGTYSVFFWHVFSRIRTEYGEVQRISPYSVRMWENTDQKISEYGHFLSSVNPIYFSRTIDYSSYELKTSHFIRNVNHRIHSNTLHTSVFFHAYQNHNKC